MMNKNKTVMEMLGISRKSSPLNHDTKIDGKHVPHLKDNVGEVEKGDMAMKEGETFLQPDTAINAYPGYRKRKVGTDQETTSVEEFNENEDFPATDKFNKNKVIKGNG